ncbi:YggT family protein [Rhodoluna lacicola]|jgi:YggT family protein|uniref:YGGT family n=1 Tax=Rhodoluna lacicola TaxID=529884 RepID=A0A060JG40_9MICO|nr:YggT family protein [Rhodoluna lacicola]AIC47655.1 YGGT family [Rhodoluna lacicola]BDS50552.1 membrane protein [Rhodoluna lacicola]
MGLVAIAIWWVLQVYFFALVARLFIDLALSVNRSWRPSGLLLPVVEIVMTVTDPPLKAIRKVIPPIRLGAIQLDLGWTALVFAIFFLQRIVLSVA